MAGAGSWFWRAVRRRGPRDAQREPTPPAVATSGFDPSVWLGPYRLGAEIGRGSSGVVYRATAPDGSAVALKRIDLGDSAAEVAPSFLREANVASRLAHPGIASVRDSGVEGGVAYVAMALAPGCDLQAWCDATRLLPIPVVLEIGACVAEALDHAHRQGVLHRDIKPANVLFDPVTARATLTDFGIARVADLSRTRTGVMLGSPSYMAPEQLAGLPLDGRADLYGLGVVLYQLLTGQLPHRATPMSRLMYQIVNEVPADLRLHRPELCAEVAAVIATALEKKPANRPADGARFATALRAAALSQQRQTG